jgi:two-component system chemotaxis sensor kinase CheA
MSDDPLRYFRAEARELTAALTGDLLRLETAPSPQLVQRLLRHAHTLKGAARVVRQNDIADRVHALEAVLLPLRDGPAPPSIVADLLRQVDGVASCVKGLDREKAAAPSDDDSLDFAAADSIKLEALTETVAEAMRQVQSARGAAAPGGAAALDRAERDLAQALDAAAALRLAPAASIVTALERTVRDVAQSLGKEASFTAVGGALRLEPRVLAALRPALIQLARNAVAHGIETPAERSRRGKPTRGTVTLTIQRRGDRVAFLSGDDGAGIDLEAVRRVALERGAAPAAIAGLGADALLRLLRRRPHHRRRTEPGRRPRHRPRYRARRHDAARRQRRDRHRARNRNAHRAHRSDRAGRCRGPAGAARRHHRRGAAHGGGAKYRAAR